MMGKTKKQVFLMFMKAVYAGIAISIGGIIYLSIENKIIASLMFSFGLSTVVIQGYNLYTGKIGFVKDVKELPDMLLFIVGNYIGTFLMAVLANAASLNIDSRKLAEAKLSKGPMQIFLLAFFCGVMMYLAIDNYQKSKNFLFVIAPVMIFILSGFEHSVADMFYLNLAQSFNLKTFAYIGLMLLGNGVGAKVYGLGSGWFDRMDAGRN
ncbi:MAG: formate/nitrite transporter family protein [Lachnospiraceae bacterium]|nr:formate/nitrite transporter family protein [Lachnospiraceae bacterium]